MNVDELPERLRSRIEVQADGCWLWIRGIGDNGYGRLWVPPRLRLAHRHVYELLAGPILPGLTLDHLCRVRRCVNPAHLEPCTMGENTLRSPIAVTAVNARKTECPRGHEYDADNTRLFRGKRYCRACKLMDDRGRYARRQAARQVSS